MNTNIDASINNSVFRRDFKQVIACKIQICVILPVRVKSRLTVPYNPGQLLGRLTSAAGAEEGLFASYDDTASGASAGLATARCVLLDYQEAAASGTNELGAALFSGIVYKSALIGEDSNADTDLGAKSIIDASGVELLKF